MGLMVRYSIVTFCFFISIFPVATVYFPVAPYRILHFAGLIYLLYVLYNKKIRAKGVLDYIFGILILLGYSLLVVFVNGTNDMVHVIQEFNMILSICSALFVISLIREEDRSIHVICNLLTVVFVFQEFISILMFVSPAFYEIATSVIRMDNTYSELSYQNLVGYRIIGLGNMGWASGANYGFFLLILTLMPHVKGTLFYKSEAAYFLVFALTLIVGVLSARTFLLFIPLAFFLSVKLFGSFKKALHSIFSMISKNIALLIAFLVLGTYYVSKNIDIDRWEETVSFAFELIINYEKEGHLNTGSIEAVNDFYEILPKSALAWIIGEGRFSGEDGGYYMDVDAGYVRQLFFYGIVGILFYWLCLYNLYKKTMKQAIYNKYKILFQLMFISCLILNYKGIIDMTFYVSIFYALGLLSSHYSNGKILKTGYNK